MKIQGTPSLPPQTGRLLGMSRRNLCYIGVDFDTVLKSTDKEKTCELPDGNITVGAWRFRRAKVLFQPSFTGEGASGIHVICFPNEV